MKKLYEKSYANIWQNCPQKKYTFYLEKKISFKYLKRLLPDKVEVQIDHDTALHLDATDLTKGGSEMNSYKLYAIRDDKERASVARESKPFRLWLDPVSVAGSFDEWVQYQARAEKVITNRLHSAILGTTLGKRVTLLPNSYHKNRSVYSYSLEERGVTWKEKIEKTLTGRFLSVLPSRITNSTKIVRSMCALRDTFRFGATADR